MVVHYCVQLFFGGKHFQNDYLLSFSFPLLILFSFLLAQFRSFGILKMLTVISQNIGCLIKTQIKFKKTAPTQFFKG